MLSYLDILELGAGLFGHVQVLPQSCWEIWILHLQQIGVWAVLVTEMKKSEKIVLESMCKNANTEIVYSKYAINFKTAKKLFLLLYSFLVKVGPNSFQT